MKVDCEFGVGVGLLGVNELFYGDWTKRVLPMALCRVRSWEGVLQ